MRTLKDRLSHLSFAQACKLLGSQGRSLIMEGGKFNIDLVDQVYLDKNRFCLTLGNVRVNISLTSDNKRMHLRCSACKGACEHQGAALSLILEEKLALGLSAPPPHRKPMESLGEEDLVKQAVAEREQRAVEEKMRLKSMNPELLWTDYVITNPVSGKSYRLALRGWQPGESVTIYPDAEEYMQKMLFKARMKALTDEIRKDPAAHPLRGTLLDAQLRPYQMDT